MNTEIPDGCTSSRKLRAWDILRVVLSIVLLCTATLKFQGYDNIDATTGISSELLLTGAVLEIVLGIWLLAGSFSQSLWCCTFLFFAALSCISGIFVLKGQSTCNCLGRIATSPVYVFGFDCAVLVLLLLIRPVLEKGALWSMKIGPSCFVRSLGIFLAAGIISYSLVLVGASMFRSLTGNTLRIEPAISSAGSGASGVDHTFTIRIVNDNDHPVSLIGGTTSCSCAVIEDLPVTIPSSNSCEIRIKMRFSGTPGYFQHRFVIYTDDARQSNLSAKFNGEVISLASK